ncbi:MAG TPA: rhodanese-like domain-containing protein [Actinobacteria bacterium]|nr:rhodanese-like domain-containing protein [Actinomycetota bacterium]
MGLGIIIAIIIAGLSGGCAKTQSSTETPSSNAYKNVTPKELKPMLDDKGLFLVDVHIPEQKHIVGTDLVVPYNEIERNIDKFPSDKSTKIALYCRSGGMSVEAARKLIELGYENVFNLAGGAGAWTAAGYPVEQ